MFWKAIQANGEERDADIVNLFCFTLRDAILEWSKKIMQSHSGYIFLELGAAFCKQYHTIQNNEHVYMAFRVIKQGNDEKVEVYYEQILKLANCFQQKVDDNLLTTFFRARLVSYLQIATTRMKRNTLFEHK